MALGMTYEQYWYGDPLMARAFYKADQLRQQRINDEAWLNGAYILRALQATVGNLFLKQGAKPYEYPRKPIDIAEETKEEKELREEQEVVYAQAYMSNMILAGKSWGKEARQ